MAQPSDLENQAVFALPDRVGFSADFALQDTGCVSFQNLSIVVDGLYQ
ncbi:hypothetical protein [Parapusillimonas granuli]|uniref:Uncharacterized protein n=1 Tax=Parapusillimonas granuli TaxID=380911 RepID=A0A853G995_9BURK|nr:hypothetical protein [Parapusillimonas granuli]MBB5217521.1 hypothetical protein [Parapusillimonas granuli]NYT51286.1 hypothetical protein [Parapusillimonas granuli]